jgi:hypothetical protein
MIVARISLGNALCSSVLGAEAAFMASRMRSALAVSAEGCAALSLAPGIRTDPMLATRTGLPPATRTVWFVES